jgi:type IV secretion system protein TrbF
MSDRRSTPSDPALTPYLAGRREWNERYGDYIARARTWRAVALLALLAALISSGGLVYVASQSQIVPYIVRVDKLGAAAAVERADLPSRPDHQLIVSSLARWIADIRSVYTDAGAQRTLINEGYAFLDAHSDAYVAMNDYMSTHNPFDRAQTETVSVSVETVLPVSQNSWRIEWREETRTRDGRERTTKPWQAQATIALNKPADEKTLRLNPLGIYVTAFNWSERL